MAEYPELGTTDEIEFKKLGNAVEIIVNGRNLIEVLREIETPWAAWEGCADLAGRYCGLGTEHVLPPSRHFWGEPSLEYLPGDSRVPILGCADCGDHHCWPILVRISVTEKAVSWTDFEQPHRPKWKYRDLFFQFDRSQYEASLNAAATRAESQ